MEQLMTIKELVEIFQVNRSTIYNWIKKEKLPAPIKIGKAIRWSPNAIREAIKDKSPGPILGQG